MVDSMHAMTGYFQLSIVGSQFLKFTIGNNPQLCQTQMESESVQDNTASWQLASVFPWKNPRKTAGKYFDSRTNFSRIWAKLNRLFCPRQQDIPIYSKLLPL
jgi:hypothetical protein